MPNKNKCTKCGQRHVPPTGKKCKRPVPLDDMSEDSEVNMTLNYCNKCGQSHDLPRGKKCKKTLELDSTSDDSDADIPLDNLASKKQKINNFFTKQNNHKLKISEQVMSREEDKEEEVDTQKVILMEMQRINQRLEVIESQVTGLSREHRKEPTHVYEQSKLSTHSSCTPVLKKVSKYTTVSSSDSDTSNSDSEGNKNVPSLSKLRDSVRIQKRVDDRLRELESLQNTQGKGNNDKIKSKRGGPEVLVKHKIAWPHEAILGEATRSRLTYDQLSMSQWVQGFCQNILDENDTTKREQMISYMSDLMEDATDFSWQGAKAAHAVLCCELERGTVTWNDSHRIDRIRRAHAQKHVSNSAKTWGKLEQKRKPWYCKFYQNGTCTHNKDHEVGGRLHRHVCATCLQQGKVSAHPEKDCSMVNKQTKNG